MKNLLKKIVPESVWGTLRNRQKSQMQARTLANNYDYDRLRFERYASPNRNFLSNGNRVAYLVMLYHSLEKGMSMPEPKYGYGKAKANELLDQIEECIQLECDKSQVLAAVSVLEAYNEFNTAQDITSPDLTKRLAQIKHLLQDENRSDVRPVGGGKRLIQSATIEEAREVNFRSFAFSRHSVRNFTDKEVSTKIIEEAVAIAQKSPSVCNRQSSKVHVYDNNTLGQQLLEIQGGNNGFGHTANKILVVTSDLSSFLSPGERNQCWIDGGLFAMTLIYALHSLGVSTCCLNWSKELEVDERFRLCSDIPRQENVIMLIVAGYTPKEFYVPYSHRVPVAEILTLHKTSHED